MGKGGGEAMCQDIEDSLWARTSIEVIEVYFAETSLPNFG